MIQKFNKILLILAILFIAMTKYTFASSIPYVAADSFIVIDAASGRIIGAKNADKKLPMASTTKIMTAILAIDNNKDLSHIIEVPERCTNIEGSSLYLRPGQKVSIIDLLYGTMLRSGNDSALTLADYIGNGDDECFIEMMNNKAKSLGAYNTNFKNPNGLHDDEHYTTAHDLAIISQYAMKNTIFREIASSKLYKADSLNTILYNKNKVVHQYEYGNGIKIGYTKAAGRCLVASAKKGETEIITVILNDSNWFQDSYKIFDWAFNNYNFYGIVDEGQYLCDSERGKPLFSNQAFGYLLTQDEVDSIKFVFHITIPHIINDKRYPQFGYFDVFLKNEIIFTGILTNSAGN